MGERGVGVGGGIGLLVGLEEGEVIERDLDTSQLHCMLCFVVLRGDSSDGSRDSCRVGGDRDFFDSVGGIVGFWCA